MPEMRARSQGTIGVAPRNPARPALSDTDAASPAGVVRPVCGRRQSRPTSAQILRRAPAIGSVGRGDGCSLAGCRGRRGPARAGTSPCGAGAAAWVRSGSPARCRDLGRPGGTVGGCLGQNAAHEATVRTWTTSQMHQRLRCLRPGPPGSRSPDSRQVDCARRRCGDDWFDARGLRGGAARSGGPGGFRVDGSARAMTRLPAETARVGALTPTAAAASVLAAGPAVSAALGQTAPPARGDWSIGTTSASNWRYRKHRKSICQTGFYTGRVAAALLDGRAFQPGIGPLGVPDLRFGG
jgi:hypothetical protein